MRRVIFYMFYDDRGIVDDYVTAKLAALRQHADHIMVVSNSVLTPDSRRRLDEVADAVYVRNNVGFDVWAYKEAMEVFGRHRLDDFDELVLTNYTYFGPIYPFAETFDRMDAQHNLDFWGLTSHKRLAENPLAPDPRAEALEAHIQSHWIAVRKTMFTSLEFQQYWDQMPMITSYLDSIRYHEARFTKHFADCGFRYRVAFPAEDYPTDHPIMESTGLMLDDRCPIVKRRLFFHDPLYLDRNAILPSRIMAKVVAAGYPAELILRNLTRSSEPRVLYTNLAMFSVLPDIALTPPSAPPPRICVLAHIYYDDMVDELMASIGTIPVPYDLVITTDTEQKRVTIAAAVRARTEGKIDVRVVESNNGRSESAFLITCRDVLTSGAYDLVLKVHSKKSPQDGLNAATTFKRHTIDNLLSSPGYVANVLALFADDPGLGMVFPPLIHIGFPTMGHSWFLNKEPAHELAEKLGIGNVFDATTPLSPNGGMFWARPEALAKLAEYPFDFADFKAGPDGYRDGQLTHVLERLYGYAALDSGFTLRVVANQDWAAIDYPLLEYKLASVASLLPAFAEEQLGYVKRLQAIEQAERDWRPAMPAQAFKHALAVHRPRLARLLFPGYQPPPGRGTAN